MSSVRLDRLMQILAIGCLALIYAMIAHKGQADISALAQQYSGEKFWLELARYFIGNIAGGSGK